MDALLSLPVLSYFLVPSLGSYSASLNLLFFYLTWSTLILSHPPLKVELLGTLAIRALFFVLPSVMFLAFDTAVPSLAVSLKVQGANGLPTRTGGVKVRKGAPKNVWWKVVAVSLGNVALGLLLQAAVEALFTDVLRIRSAFKITTTLPMPWTIGKEILLGFVAREVSSITFIEYHARSTNMKH
jgi:hypothetical protein